VHHHWSFNPGLENMHNLHQQGNTTNELSLITITCYTYGLVLYVEKDVQGERMWKISVLLVLSRFQIYHPGRVICEYMYGRLFRKFDLS
jgi:hypothetical protein